MITSTNNAQMKHIVQLNKKGKTRYDQRVFVVEGPKMCFEAPKDSVVQMYVSESFELDVKWRDRLSDYPYEVVSDSVFKQISDTKTPQGILGLIKMPSYTLEDVTGENKERGKIPPHILLIEGIQDPGNLGTIMRTGEGAGITGIVMDSHTVDIFNPKVVRSTMGSIYRVPFLTVDDLRGTGVELKKKGITLYATHLKGNAFYNQPDYRNGAGFFIGNEGKGLSEETTMLADEYIKIPMEGQVESLNAAIAAALCMYEVKRQRMD